MDTPQRNMSRVPRDPTHAPPIIQASISAQAPATTSQDDLITSLTQVLMAF